MSARQLRRSFATPFIVTLAGSSMVAACGPKPLPTHSNPPGPHTNPPAPGATAEPTTDGTTPTEPGTPDAPVVKHTNPPVPTGPAHTDPPVHKNPPPPSAPPTTTISKNPPAPEPVKEPAKSEQRWTVTKYKGKPECHAMVEVSCPTSDEKGKPIVATCNPPPPIKYACPSGLQDGATMKIVLRAGATDCFVDYGPQKCPAGAKCNPPPPRKVACPER